jgi:hypothetical protein
MRNDLGRGDHALFQGTIPVFTWNEENHKNVNKNVATQNISIYMKVPVRTHVYTWYYIYIKINNKDMSQFKTV